LYAYTIICILQKNTSNGHGAARLLKTFVRLLPAHDLLRLPALRGQAFYDRLFNPLVSLWLLLFQRLNADHSLDAALAHARTGGADSLKPGLARGLHSDSTAAYSDSRQRLPEPFLLQVLRLLGDKISRQHAGSGGQDWRPVLLDGSTVRLRSLGDIPKEFPPHGNQQTAAGYWCLMRVVAGFCAGSGVALDCALGSLRCSEQALGAELMRRMAAGCLFIGDRNFGIFLIAQAARARGHQVLLRLTEVRAAKLLGRALRPGDHALSWQPTRQTQRLPDASTDPIPGRLLVLRRHRPGFRPLRLCLFTTLLESSLEELAQLYGRRWQVELNLRYVKTQMESAQLEVRSAAMARKEWLASLIAYNLVRAAMLCAAQHAQTDPLSLSFSACRRRLEGWLKDFGTTKRRAYARWQQLLQRLAQCRLPKRRKKRPNEPRAQRHLRQTFPPLRGKRAAARKILRKIKTKS